LGAFVTTARRRFTFQGGLTMSVVAKFLSPIGRAKGFLRTLRALHDDLKRAPLQTQLHFMPLVIEQIERAKKTLPPARMEYERGLAHALHYIRANPGVSWNEAVDGTHTADTFRDNTDMSRLTPSQPWLTPFSS
jgi:hypothetical protein